MSVIVTDHALVRYIERVYQTDLTCLRKELRLRCEGAAMIKADNIIIDGWRYCLAYRHGVPSIITVKPA